MADDFDSLPDRAEAMGFKKIVIRIKEGQSSIPEKLIVNEKSFPLRRKTDIFFLIESFIKKSARKHKRKIRGITIDALTELIQNDLQGNLKKLEKVIEQAVIVCRGEYIAPADLPSQPRLISEKTLLDPRYLQDGYQQKMKSFECEMIQEAMKRCRGNKSAAAKLLHISERHLRSRLEKLGLKNVP